MVTAVGDHSRERLSVAPGRVIFEFSPTGAWLRFGPRDGRPLIVSGGFLVLASVSERGESSAMTEIIDTRAGGLHVISGMRGLEKVHEGAKNGRRYPSARPDDDGDNAVDEDRLDGRDNDGDGRIDEDFAAIGDEMVVTAYQPLPDESRPLPMVEVYQETYAWSLQHIDGMVVTRLTIRNTGREAVHDVRVGAAFAKRDEFAVESQDFGAVEEAAGRFGQPLTARGMLLHHENEAVAVIFFAPVVSGDAGSWLTGVSRSGRTISSLVEASLSEDTPGRGGGGSGSGTQSQASARYMVFGVSPSLGTLEPGDETFAYIALIAPASIDNARRSIDFAFRTVVGDGNSRSIPPPISIKRRVIWGMYELDYSGRVTITLHDPRARGINPMEIVFLKGFDLARAIRSELPDGTARLELAEEAPPSFAENEKVIMHGRLSGGEWFDAVLEPAVGPDGRHDIAAQRYFARSGKLDEALLSGSPNPFRDATTIAYEVPAQLNDEFGNEITLSGGIETTVRVYDVTGRLVTTLVDTIHSPGRYQLQWQAQNETGVKVASGVYYVKLQIGRRYVTKRLIQLK